METADVRKRITETIAAAKRRAAERRRRNADAGAAYARFLDEIAIPLFHQAAGVLKAEGYAFVVNTPGGAVQLVSGRSGEDMIELALDTTGREPEVVARIRRVKGRESVSEERPLRPGVLVDQLGEQDVMDLLAEALVPFVEK